MHVYPDCSPRVKVYFIDLSAAGFSCMAVLETKHRDYGRELHSALWEIKTSCEHLVAREQWKPLL